MKKQITLYSRRISPPLYLRKISAAAIGYKKRNQEWHIFGHCNTWFSAVISMFTTTHIIWVRTLYGRAYAWMKIDDMAAQNCLPSLLVISLQFWSCLCRYFGQENCIFCFSNWPPLGLASLWNEVLAKSYSRSILLTLLIHSQSVTQEIFNYVPNVSTFFQSCDHTCR
jgi:hypothetical protein